MDTDEVLGHYRVIEALRYLRVTGNRHGHHETVYRIPTLLAIIVK